MVMPDTADAGDLDRLVGPFLVDGLDDVAGQRLEAGAEIVGALERAHPGGGWKAPTAGLFLIRGAGFGRFACSRRAMAAFTLSLMRCRTSGGART